MIGRISKPDTEERYEALNKASTDFPPDAAILMWSDVEAMREGRLTSIRVVEPQTYTKVASLTKGHFSFKYLYPEGPGDKYAVTGSGSDPWWVLNPTLVRFLKKEVASLKKCLKRLEGTHP